MNDGTTHLRSATFDPLMNSRIAKKKPTQRRDRESISKGAMEMIFKSFKTKKTMVRREPEENDDIQGRSLFNTEGNFVDQNEEKKKEKRSCWYRFKKKVNAMMDHPVYIILMSCLTLIALFFSDLQTAWCPPTADLPIDFCQFLVFILFTVEIILCCMCDDSYFNSIFFWLDTVSVLSLFLDVNFISDYFLSASHFGGDHHKYKYQLALSKISVASGTTRVLRILRIIKLIRLLKLYKTVNLAKKRMAKIEEEKKKKLKQMLMQPEKSNTDSSNLETNENTDRELLKETKPKKSKKPSFKLVSVKTHIQSDDIGKVQNYNDISDETLKESRISKVITDSLNKKIFCLVMIILVVYPFLSDDFYITGKESMSYVLLNQLLESFSEFSGVNIVEYIELSNDPFFPLINITSNGELFYSNPKITKNNFRSDEVRSLISPSGLYVITFSAYKETTLTAMLNFFRTWFVCFLVALSVWFIEGSVHQIVLQPLEIMMEIIDKVCKDPANAKNINEIQSGTKATIDKFGNEGADQYEIKTIKNALIKISALLSMGFGKIGAKIINKNLVEENFDFKEKGKMIAGIYGIFSIKNYMEISKTFRKNSIVFINHIVEIIHDSIDLFSGDITRNSSNDINAIWKYSNSSFQVQKEKENPKEDTAKVDKEKISSLIEGVSELALFSMIRTYRKISKKANAYFQQENQKISLGFCLHSGYSIEGVIGSILKIDTVHVSKNTQITTIMKNASAYYGVEIVFSDSFYDSLGIKTKNLCRCIDIIRFTGYPNKTFKMYTIDLNRNLEISKKVKLYLNSTEKELVHKEKKKKLFDSINEAGSVENVMLAKRSIIEVLDNNYGEDFYIEYRKGFELYESCQWKDAKKCFQSCLKIMEDRPCEILIQYIDSFEGKAPDFWFGRDCPFE